MNHRTGGLVGLDPKILTVQGQCTDVLTEIPVKDAISVEKQNKKLKHRSNMKLKRHHGELLVV